MHKTAVMKKKIAKWLQPRLRLWAIYRELDFNPWRKPRKQRKERTSVYIGTLEAIPFVNDDAKRTLSDLFMRPGYMMRDYIFRRQHERYLAPFTALLVFYSVFTLIVAIVNPQASKSSFADGLIQGLNDSSYDASLNLTVHPDSTSVNDHEINLSDAIKSVAESVALTQLDRHPELADTPWKESLAAVEGELRSKGIPLFLGQFLILWAAIAYLLRKYKMSVSGAAAASAYVLCQYCIFMFLALILSLNTDSSLWILLLGLLLFIDYRQMLGITNRQALILTVKTGLFYLGIKILFYILLTVFLIIFTITKL